ncbi:MAG: cytochrome c biogenesis protein ResB [Spirochaetales bacterium]|nr:cytochrome c biogenesis protein ResB [Spirochaetales bacterium]
MTKRTLIIHIPLLILIFFSILSFKYDQSFELSLKEGSNINLKKIFIDNGFPLFKPTNIALIKFDNKPIGEELNKESYTSIVEINGDTKSISVNKPLNIERFQIYQMDWRIFIKAVTFEIDNSLYTLENLVKNGLDVSPKSKFYLIPHKIQGYWINYYWEEKSKDGIVLQSGFIDSDELKQKSKILLSEEKEIEISLKEEDFGYTSILLVTWKPFRIPLFISGIIFILSQLLILRRVDEHPV